MRALHLAAMVAALMLPGCAKHPAEPVNKPILVQLYPESIDLGQSFNALQTGHSTLAIDCKNVSPDAVIVFASYALPADLTPRDAPPNCLMASTIPDVLLKKPGIFDVYIRDAKGESNHAEFIVRP